MTDDRYYIIHNGLWAGSEFLDHEGFVRPRTDVLRSLQVEHDPFIAPNMYTRNENGERERIPRYIPPTVEEIEDVLSSVFYRRTELGERRVRFMTGPTGLERYQAVADEIGVDWTFNIDIAETDSISITERIRPIQNWHNLTHEQQINQLDQISREDV